MPPAEVVGEDQPLERVGRTLNGAVEDCPHHDEQGGVGEEYENERGCVQGVVPCHDPTDAESVAQVPRHERARNREEGVDDERKKYDTALGAYRTSFSQGQVAVQRNSVRRFLDMDPRSESLAVVIVRLGTLGTGGGGVAVVGGGASNTVVHEWGHAFGMLLDHIDKYDLGHALRLSLLEAIAAGESTRDLGGKLDTSEFTQVVIDRLEHQLSLLAPT